MKLGVLTVLFHNQSFEEMLDIVCSYGLDCIELGTGNYPGSVHCNPDDLLSNNKILEAFRRSISDRGLFISALSCHGNPLHPQREIASKFHDTWRKTVLLAERLGVDCINVFSGCPGDSDNSFHSNWVTCSWPPEFREILKWQWDAKLIPYWKDEAEFAVQHFVKKIAFEMHPGFMIYNPESLLKLRNMIGPQIGANFDPSHLVWQGIDPIEAIKLLGKEKSIFHVHAKDIYLDYSNIKINGVLDTKAYDKVAERSWTFRTIGYGLTESTWKNMISALRVIGYDYVISIEHEDCLASPQEGFSKAVSLLNCCLFHEPGGEMWWV